MLHCKTNLKIKNTHQNKLMKTSINPLRRLAVLAATLVTLAGAAFAGRGSDVELLGEGDSMTYTIWLNAGDDFEAAAEGDEDALDIDMIARTPSGRVIDADTLSDAEPVVAFRAPCSGYYKIEVRMVDTYYGVNSYMAFEYARW
ncbi:MAG: hypothetical protein ACI9R3_001739 [Verrucomicrobiales bacterium]